MHVLCLFLLKSFFKTHVSTDSCEPIYSKTSNKKRLRQVKAWVERLKRPPAENAKILFNETEGSK